MSKSSKQELSCNHTDAERDTSRRLGFIQGEFAVPDDFDQMGKNEIAQLFQAVSLTTCGYRFNRDGANKR
ncbi:MAG: hypothetical protein WC825_11695 [Gallionellaceae bacterium]|jgi:hypothetical protein